MFSPKSPAALASWVAPVTPESVVNWSAGAETLKRRGRPLGGEVLAVSYLGR